MGCGSDTYASGIDIGLDLLKIVPSPPSLTSTTVASAYVKPIAAGYLAALEGELAGLGIAAPLLLMLSGGGLTHAAEVNRNPVQTNRDYAPEFDAYRWNMPHDEHSPIP